MKELLRAQTKRKYREMAAVFHLLNSRDKRDAKWSRNFVAYHYFYENVMQIYDITARYSSNEVQDIEEPSLVYISVKSKKYSTESPWELPEPDKPETPKAEQASLF